MSIHLYNCTLTNALCRVRILHMWPFCTSLLHSHMGSHMPSSEEKYTTEIDDKLWNTWDMTPNTATASGTARFPSVLSCFNAHPLSLCICLCNDYKNDLTTSFCLWNNMNTHTPVYTTHTHTCTPVYTTHTYKHTCIHHTHTRTPIYKKNCTHTHTHMHTYIRPLYPLNAQM